MDEQTLPSLVLASGSRYRANLLDRLGLAFDVMSPDVDESTRAGETALQLAMRLADAKARAVSSDHSDPLFIGSDQVAACDNRLLGKPGTPENAIDQLTFCAGKHVVFFTAITLWRPSHNICRSAVASTEVAMRRLSLDEIKRYVQRDMPLDCAGSFKWESMGIALFRSVVGEDPSALEGLPLIELGHLLREQGFQVP